MKIMKIMKIIMNNEIIIIIMKMKMNKWK
jgi:hypothetical protein